MKEKEIVRGGVVFTPDEKRMYEMFVNEMVKIISKYGKEALDKINTAA